MPRWTPEARERQRKLIQQWRPWEHSTGPTSDYGKSVSSQNSPYRSEAWQQWQASKPILEHMEQFLATGIDSDEMLEYFPIAIEGLKRILRSD